MVPILAVPVIIVGLVGSLLLGSMGVANLTEHQPTKIVEVPKTIEDIKQDLHFDISKILEHMIKDRNYTRSEWEEMHEISYKVATAKTKSELKKLEKLIQEKNRKLVGH